MEHLALEVFDLATTENPNPTGSQYAVLEPDESLTITDTSEIFADGDVWSYDFTLNVHANAHLFGTAGELHGSRLHEQIHKRKARLWVEGLPLYLGYLMLGDEAEVDADGNVDVTFESGQKTFEEMLDGVNARQISVGDVVIGVSVVSDRVIPTATITGKIKPDTSESKTLSKDGYTVNIPQEINFSIDLPSVTQYAQKWPKLVISKGTGAKTILGVPTPFDFTNVQSPYDDSHPFCNVNICYQRKYKADPNDPNSEEKKARGYITRLAYGNDTTTGGDNETRFNNAPNFYLLYWLKRLFIDTGISVTENQMNDVEDLRRVFLANLGCFYKAYDNVPAEAYDVSGGQVIIDGDVLYGGLTSSWVLQDSKLYPEADDKGSVLLRNVAFKEGGVTRIERSTMVAEMSEMKYSGHGEGVSTYGSEVGQWIDFGNAWNWVPDYFKMMGWEAHASGENYPNVDAMEIIKATETAFGARYLFSSDFSKVRIVLLRNIFRSSEVQNIACEITCDDEKVENNIRGFRMTYGKGNEDTTFFYKGFDDMLPKKKAIWKDETDKHDYSKWKLNADYEQVKKKEVTSFNKTCYVTPVNGNAYGVKIDEDETVFFPTLHEYAGYMDAEDGDCTGETNTVDTVTVNAAPLITNDVDGTYAVFVGEDMKAPGRVEIASHMYAGTQHRTDIVATGKHGSSDVSFSMEMDVDIYVKEGYIINLQDNYNISDGTSTPFDNIDLGLMFGIMRGSGSDSYIKYDDDTIENEAPMNDYWEVVPGSGAIDHPDTCDGYGNEWDYNGTCEGIGNRDGRVSLKLRAEKPNPYYVAGSSDADKKNRYLEITNKNLQGRGLCDQFYKEYSYWVRNARIVKRTVRLELAQLLAIDKTKRVTVGDVTGFIRKMQFSVSNETGLGIVVMEIMYI